MEVDLSSILPMQAQLSKPNCTELQGTTMEGHLRLVLLLYWNFPSTLKAVPTWKWSLWKIKVALFLVMSISKTNLSICCSLEQFGRSVSPSVGLSVDHSVVYLFFLWEVLSISQSVAKSVSQ